MRLRIATRRSPLALWQATHVAQLLVGLGVGAEVHLVEVDTVGDRRPEVSIADFGGKGVFVKEVQAAVLRGDADLAVHSAKDLPSLTPDGLVLASVPQRGDPRDALVGRSMTDLAVGATVATGSQRRRVQLAAIRGDLEFCDLRGNIATRLEKVPVGGAAVVAVAALTRLGLEDTMTTVFNVDEMVPQVGQGALAVECRADDAVLREMLGAIEHAESRREVDAERAFLAELGGDCRLPAGAHAQSVSGALTLTGLLAASVVRGARVERHTAAGDDPVELGRSVARHLSGAVGVL